MEYTRNLPLCGDRPTEPPLFQYVHLLTPLRKAEPAVGAGLGEAEGQVGQLPAQRRGIQTGGRDAFPGDFPISPGQLIDRAGGHLRLDAVGQAVDLGLQFALLLL